MKFLITLTAMAAFAPRLFCTTQASSEVIAMGGVAGDAVAVWQDMDFSTGTNSIWTASAPGLTGTWGTRVKLSGSQNAVNPKIAMNDSGQILVVWQVQESSGIVTLYGLKNTFGTSWPSSSTLLSDDEEETVNDLSHSVAIGSNGRCTVAWESVLLTAESVVTRANNSTFLGSWSGPTTLSNEF
jgi:hypothetical protein